MLKGLNDSVPWFYNSGLYVTFENLKTLAPPGSWPKAYGMLLNALRALLTLSVLSTFALILYKSRKRDWTQAARAHFNFLMAIAFFSLLGHIVYEAYLTFVFILLAYLLASHHYLKIEGRVLTGAIFLLCFWQNIIWVDLFRYLFHLDSILELISIGLFKSAPLLLLLIILWRHHEELFRSYESEAWKLDSSALVHTATA
jgi:hypothetical protein